MNEVNWMQQGWECPKCGAVMAPHVDCCVNCRGKNIDITINTTASPIQDWFDTFLQDCCQGKVTFSKEDKNGTI